MTPRGGADRVEGVGPAGELLVRVRAIPADGAANQQVVLLIAKELGVPRSAVEIESGSRARRKRVAVEGLPTAQIRARWPTLPISES